MSHTWFRFLCPRSRSWWGQRSKSCLSNNSKTTEANLTKLHRKIEHNEKVCHAQELGSYAQGQGSLAVFKVTARDQGHYKGPSGAFVTYCNISCLFFLGPIDHHDWTMCHMQGPCSTTRLCPIHNFVLHRLAYTHQYSLPADTIHQTWLPPRLSVISCFLLRMLLVTNSFLPKLSTWFCFLPRIMQTV